MCSRHNTLGSIGLWLYLFGENGLFEVFVNICWKKGGVHNVGGDTYTDNDIRVTIFMIVSCEMMPASL
jgi:hypothetical protein